MAQNEFLAGRVAVANFPLLASTAAQTVNGGLFVPTGALVTGVTYLNTATPTIDSAANTVVLYCGDVPLVSAVAISVGASAINIPYTATLVSTAGMYLTAGAQLKLRAQASNGTNAWTWKPDIYVGYVGA
jgi:hypothetical protein